MCNILKYEKQHELELLALLKAEPDWNSFTGEGTIDIFREVLLNSESYICKTQSVICGYLRALVDGFGIYVSELYVAPPYRNQGYGKALLNTIRQAHLHQIVYVLSDEDGYYEKLGCKRIGSVFQLSLSG
jgi:ribosomal protein S18 acetylase RimI-like enzyme